MRIKQLAISVAMLAASGAALAFSGELSTADAGFVPSKTRAQVIQELTQAQADGSFQAAHSEFQDQTAIPSASGSAPSPSFTSPRARSFALKDGSTVYVFNDGKMGMESKYGKPMHMPEGHAMVTQDGRTILMIGDEVARMDAMLQTEFAGGR